MQWVDRLVGKRQNGRPTCAKGRRRTSSTLQARRSPQGRPDWRRPPRAAKPVRRDLPESEAARRSWAAARMATRRHRTQHATAVDGKSRSVRAVGCVQQPIGKTVARRSQTPTTPIAIMAPFAQLHVRSKPFLAPPTKWIRSESIDTNPKPEAAEAVIDRSPVAKGRAALGGGRCQAPPRRTWLRPPLES